MARLTKEQRSRRWISYCAYYRQRDLVPVLTKDRKELRGWVVPLRISDISMDLLLDESITSFGGRTGQLARTYIARQAHVGGALAVRLDDDIIALLESFQEASENDQGEFAVAIGRRNRTPAEATAAALKRVGEGW